jgi:hypothetical protein
MKSPLRHKSSFLVLAALLLLQVQIAFGGCLLRMGGEQTARGAQIPATQAPCEGMTTSAGHRVCLATCEHNTNSPWSGLDFSAWSLLAPCADYFLQTVLLEPAPIIVAAAPPPASGPAPYLRLHRFLS